MVTVMAGLYILEVSSYGEECVTEKPLKLHSYTHSLSFTELCILHSTEMHYGSNSLQL